MWPFERWRETDVLRVCRDAAEHWASQPAGLVRQQREPLAPPLDVPALEDAIARLFAGTRGRRRLDVVIESAWLPVMLLAPGAALRHVADLEALLREALVGLYEPGDTTMAQWQLQIDGLPGDEHVCGYALDVRLREGVMRALHAAGVTACSVQPVWAWARAHASQRATRGHSGWWLWQESDRTLVAGLRRGRVQSLHPAMAPMNEHFDLRATVAAEATRTRLPATDPLLIGGWLAPPAVANAAGWHAVSASAGTAGPAISPAPPMSTSSRQPPVQR